MIKGIEVRSLAQYQIDKSNSVTLTACPKSVCVLRVKDSDSRVFKLRPSMEGDIGCECRAVDDYHRLVLMPQN